MNELTQNKYVRFFISVAYISLIVVLIWLIIKYLLIYFLPFILGFLFSRIISPLIKLLKRKFKMSEKFTSLVLTVLLLLCIIFILYLLISKIAGEIGPLSKQIAFSISGLMDKLDVQLERLSFYFKDLFPDLKQNITSFISNLPSTLDISGTVLPGIAKTASFMPNVLLFIIATAVSTYFISSDYDNIKSFMLRALKPSTYEKIIRTKKLLFSSLFGWLRAQLILGSINFCVLTFGFLILRIQYALLLALCIALIDMLPVLGCGTVLIPWSVICIINGDYKKAIGIAVVYGATGIMRNSLESKIVGKQIGLHPLVTLMSIYVGFMLFGILGMFLVPVAVLVLVQFNEWGYIKLWQK